MFEKLFQFGNGEIIEGKIKALDFDFENLTVLITINTERFGDVEVFDYELECGTLEKYFSFLRVGDGPIIFTLSSLNDIILKELLDLVAPVFKVEKWAADYNSYTDSHILKIDGNISEEFKEYYQYP